MFTLIGSLNLIFKEHRASLSAELKSYRVDFVLSRAILKISHRRLSCSPEKRRLKRRRSREEVNYTHPFLFVKDFLRPQKKNEGRCALPRRFRVSRQALT